jgi:hypothetical protein
LNDAYRHISTYFAGDRASCLTKTSGWEGAYIYINATVILAKKMGKHAAVAASTVVMEDVADYALVAGNPAIKKSVE